MLIDSYLFWYPWVRKIALYTLNHKPVHNLLFWTCERFFWRIINRVTSTDEIYYLKVNYVWIKYQRNRLQRFLKIKESVLIIKIRRTKEFNPNCMERKKCAKDLMNGWRIESTKIEHGKKRKFRAINQV